MDGMRAIVGRRGESSKFAPKNDHVEGKKSGVISYSFLHQQTDQTSSYLVHSLCKPAAVWYEYCCRVVETALLLYCKECVRVVSIVVRGGGEEAARSFLPCGQSVAASGSSRGSQQKFPHCLEALYLVGTYYCLRSSRVLSDRRAILGVFGIYPPSGTRWWRCKVPYT